jgi:hypothetical protein
MPNPSARVKTTTKTEIARYSLFKKAMAPSWMASEISTIREDPGSLLKMRMERIMMNKMPSRPVRMGKMTKFMVKFLSF